MTPGFRRFRTTRVDEKTRTAFRETVLYADDFIWPVFCVDGRGRKEEISSMPEVYRLSADVLIDTLYPLVEKGLRSVMLFGVPNSKGIEQAWNDSGIVQQFIPQLKEQFPELGIITDVCICSYSNDGHCHIGDNDRTGEILAKIALSHARAGADIVAPSAMMDGQVYYIRKELESEGFDDVKIMSYAAKFASSYYSPFRNAADCTPQSGDRSGYQMDPANGNEAMEEIEEDIRQGADSVIVKPALAYLDIVNRASDMFSVPVIAYNVSGEYSLLLKGVRDGLINEQVILETLLSVKRAGAQRTISYFVPFVFGRDGVLEKRSVSAFAVGS